MTVSIPILIYQMSLMSFFLQSKSYRRKRSESVKTWKRLTNNHICQKYPPDQIPETQEIFIRMLSVCVRVGIKYSLCLKGWVYKVVDNWVIIEIRHWWDKSKYPGSWNAEHAELVSKSKRLAASNRLTHKGYWAPRKQPAQSAEIMDALTIWLLITLWHEQQYP